MRLIDADKLKQESFAVYTKEYGFIDVVGVDSIDKQPTLQSSQVEDTKCSSKHGKWLFCDSDCLGSSYKCTNCNSEFLAYCDLKIDSNYCPNCGAKMDIDSDPQEREM